MNAAKRRICLCREAPTAETAVNRHVAIAGAPMFGHAMEL
jgi:hypothetical protein